MKNKTVSLSGVIFHFETKACGTFDQFIQDSYQINKTHSDILNLNSKIIEFLLAQLHPGKQLITLNDIKLLLKTFSKDKKNSTEINAKVPNSKNVYKENLTRDLKFILHTIIRPSIGFTYTKVLKKV